MCLYMIIAAFQIHTASSTDYRVGHAWIMIGRVNFQLKSTWNYSGELNTIFKEFHFDVHKGGSALSTLMGTISEKNLRALILYLSII